MSSARGRHRHLVEHGAADLELGPAERHQVAQALILQLQGFTRLRNLAARRKVAPSGGS